jgi:hypothetical protein
MTSLEKGVTSEDEGRSYPERDELTKEKDDFIRGEETINEEKAELERGMQNLEGQRARNASRITRWIEMLEELYQEVDIIRHLAQQRPRQPGRGLSSRHGGARSHSTRRGQSIRPGHGGHEIVSPKKAKCKWESPVRFPTVSLCFW